MGGWSQRIDSKHRHNYIEGKHTTYALNNDVEDVRT